MAVIITAQAAEPNGDGTFWLDSRGIILRMNQSMSEPSRPDGNEPPKRDWLAIWSAIVRAGLGERLLTAASAIVTAVLFFIVVWLMNSFFVLRSERIGGPSGGSSAAPYYMDAVLPYYDPSYPMNETLPLNAGLTRRSTSHTDLPMKPRYEVRTYHVVRGDTVIGIAEKFNLKPSTIFWGNPYTLHDDPHALLEGMDINILPVDGVYTEWHEGDGLNTVAEVYGVTPESIIEFPANGLSLETIGDFSNPNIPAGKWLVVPGGTRSLLTWSAPFVTRENPAVASIYGPGACESVMDGPVGSGTFLWPTSERYISGYDYSEASNHRAIDIGGKMGNPIYSADAGVIVYAGWNDWGYGNVLMVDHGNGWQTLYAHLESYNVQCGYYVGPGDIIGAMGSTGNSSGPHLHYEMRYNGVPQNPHNFY